MKQINTKLSPDRLRDMLLIFSLSLLAFLLGLHDKEFIKINSRFALFTSEMRQYGIYLFPTLYGKPYLDYLSPFIYLSYLSSGGGRWVNMLTITAPSALAASASLLMTYLIGLQLNRKTALYGVLACLMTYGFVQAARAPSLDMFVLFFTTTAFYLVYSADRTGKWRRLFLLPPVLIASFTIRGPLGIVIPAAVIFSYYLVNRRYLMSIITGGAAALTGVVCLGTTLYLYSYYGGHELLQQLLNNQIFHRMYSSRPFWFFLSKGIRSFALAFPTALLVIIFYWKKLWRKPQPGEPSHLQLMRALTAWLLIVLIGMSIPGNKHLRYILPIIPAAALLSATIFTNPDTIKLFAVIKKIFVKSGQVMPLLAAIALSVGIIIIKIMGIDIPQHNFIIALLLFSTIAVSLTVMQRYTSFTPGNIFYIEIIVIVILIIHITVIGPAEEYKEGASKFVQSVEQLRQGHEVYFFNLGPDGDELKYLVNLAPRKRFIPKFIFPQHEYRAQTATKSTISPMRTAHPRNSSRKRHIMNWLSSLLPEQQQAGFPPLTPKYIIYHDYKKMLTLPCGTIFITRDKYYDRSFPVALKPLFEVVARGKLGHRHCVAFRLRPVHIHPFRI